jgi:hypothetical protein
LRPEQLGQGGVAAERIAIGSGHLCRPGADVGYASAVHFTTSCDYSAAGSDYSGDDGQPAAGG